MFLAVSNGKETIVEHSFEETLHAVLMRDSGRCSLGAAIPSDTPG